MSDLIEMLAGILTVGAILIYSLIMFDMVHEIANASTSIANCYVNNVCEYKKIGE